MGFSLFFKDKKEENIYKESGNGKIGRADLTGDAEKETVNHGPND